MSTAFEIQHFLYLPTLHKDTSKYDCTILAIIKQLKLNCLYNHNYIIINRHITEWQSKTVKLLVMSKKFSDEHHTERATGHWKWT